MESLGLNPVFWRDKRVYVTGHTGFKGSWLCLCLHRLGALVSGYSLPPSQPSLFVAAALAEITNDSRGDITDAQSFAAHLRSSEPEIVFHLAAQPLVRRSILAPLETYRTNAYGTAAMLEAIRKAPSVRAAVVVTSDKCYDLSRQRERYNETDPLGGEDPYSASKAAAELIVSAYRATFWQEGNAAPRVATARAGNVIGGGDWSEDRILPDLIAAFLAGKPALIRNPEAVRPWQHVLDPLRGYVTLAQRLFEDGGRQFAAAWNFGPPPENEMPVSYVADAAASFFRAGAAWRKDERAHPHEAPVLRLDSNLAAAKLGWTAQIPLRKAIQLTVQWYKDFAAGASARELCDRDVENFATSEASI